MHGELFTEFNYCVAEHLEFSERSPHDALLVLLDKHDLAFNREALHRVQNCLQLDKVPGRAVVAIQIGRIVAVRSCLPNLRLMTRQPRYAP
jgi:hypothetical protein